MKTILQKLAISSEEYETIIGKLYSSWCESVSTTNKEYQQVLINRSINKWFLIELAKCETEFLETIHFYDNSNVTAEDFQRCHLKCISKLFNIRPMALLKNIVKPKAKGVRVFNAIYIN
ncbi:MAG: hypothetical protein REI96_06170 [Flavobacterium nitrogenifigens]|uniref:hypothetical protein n=1 Tax=Flavobacterium nitrogenifigens TaxID=1617283 RepID=UPI0028089F44|nr:hypothetical protein [Flavobacterium nitrogenifigens]MDQ8012012.1 hypothetical protein [Flavobacterium nitrogenifigens]